MFWLIIGTILLLWVIYDLVKGIVWSYRAIERKIEPFQYWFWIVVWLFLAFICLLYPLFFWNIW